MSGNLKRRILGLIVAALLLTVLIAAALPRLQIVEGFGRPGNRHPRPKKNDGRWDYWRRPTVVVAATRRS